MNKVNNIYKIKTKTIATRKDHNDLDKQVNEFLETIDTSLFIDIKFLDLIVPGFVTLYAMVIYKE